jgi:2-methylisocitrate lyase-like PEP mutase family enzyme
MFCAFAKAMRGVKLLAGMTELGQTPFFTAREFEAMGYKMVIWPVSALRVANKAQEKEKLYRILKRDGGTQAGRNHAHVFRRSRRNVGKPTPAASKPPSTANTWPVM